MSYTTISISKELKKKILMVKLENDKGTLEELLEDMYKKYTEEEVDGQENAR